MSLLQQTRSRPTIVTVAALLVIGFGLVFRLRLYLLNLSFWLDEAMLALNITNHTFGGLARPLDYDQGAPLGFLWLSKLSSIVLGNNEFSLRLLPFLAACLAIFVLWRVSARINQPAGMLFALLIFATSRHIVSYGVQFKQYAVDVAVALLLYLLVLNLLDKKPAPKDYRLAGMLGGLSIWISHPAVFTLGGMGLVLIGLAAKQRDWRRAGAYAAIASFWALNFLVLYFIQYRGLAANAFLTQFWAEFFMPLSASAPAWTLDRLVGLVYNPGGLAVELPAAVILVLLLAGMLLLIRKKQAWVWVFLLSLLLTLAASGLGKYPFGGRMGMFAVPGLLLCMGAGIDLVASLFGSRRTLGLVSAFLIAGVLAFNTVAFSVELIARPKLSENIAPTMAFLEANYRPGDVIYLYRMSIPAYRYYAPKYGLGGAQVINGADHHLDRTGYQAELDQMKGDKRVWLLFSHLTDDEYVEDRDFILKVANEAGEKKREFSEGGTFINLYLYDFAP